MIGIPVTLILSVVGYMVVGRTLGLSRTSRTWVAVTILLVGVLLTFTVYALWGSRLALKSFNDEVSLPMTFQQEEREGSFTLHEDGSAVLEEVVLGSRVDVVAGRRCLSGEITAVSGEGAWSFADDGKLVLAADGKRTLLVPEDSLVMSDGWRKTYMATPCDQEFADIYRASSSE